MYHLCIAFGVILSMSNTKMEEKVSSLSMLSAQNGNEDKGLLSLLNIKIMNCMGQAMF
jgi:hypothetical protein